MGIKIFDLPPGGLKDGAIATPSNVVQLVTEADDTKTKVVKNNKKVELGPVVRECFETDMSDDPPTKLKYVKYDADNNVVSTHLAGSDEFEKATDEYRGIDSDSVKASMKTMLALHMLRVEFPMEVIDEINSHIDEDIIPNSEDASVGLVGQINQNEKSAQLVFGLIDEVGKLLKEQLDKAGKSFVKKGFNRDVIVDAYDAWVVNSYSGDYNPLHSHGVKTEAGLSCILYLKVPEQIENIPNPAEEGVYLNQSSGAVDGFTYFTWGNGDNQDVNRFRTITEEYVKPEVGTMLIFPNWLRHAVMPFYGDGERRTFSANMNIFENSIFENMSEKDKIKHIKNMRK